MTDTPDFLSDRLRFEGEKALVFFQSLDDASWQIVVYTEGSEWTARNILAHFLTAERGFLHIFQDILNGGSGVRQDFDIDRFNLAKQNETEHLSRSDLLREFQSVRVEMASFVSALTIEDLQREGRHPFLGVTTLAEMIKMIYRHNQIHIRDLRRLIKQ
jgi:hypothetical protein